jgi:predicted RNase H-like HicB family nuclease
VSPRSQEFMDEARDRLAAARQIAKSGHPGSVVNAAYYAMLNAARAALVKGRGRYSKHTLMDTIRVIYHHEDDGWWAESPDVERWTAAGGSFEEVAKLAEEGVRFALERNDVELEHYVPVGESLAA